MAKYSIFIKDKEKEFDQEIAIDTDGYTVIYLEQGKMKVIGKIELSELAPILLKFGLEKFMKGK